MGRRGVYSRLRSSAIGDPAGLRGLKEASYIRDALASFNTSA